MKAYYWMTAAVFATSLAAMSAAHADSFNNLSDAATDSTQAAGRLTAAGGQVALGAVAVPLAALGTVVEGAGSAANTIASDMWDVANAPLEVDDEVVIAQPAPIVPASASSATEAR